MEWLEGKGREGSGFLFRIGLLSSVCAHVKEKAQNKNKIK
jgi:hypothetical protein